MELTVLETGISDHHKMIFFILKHIFAKEQTKTFTIEIWKTLIKKRLIRNIKRQECPNSFEKNLLNFYDTLQLFAPLKKKIIRFNNKTFMTNSLRKAILARNYKINLKLLQ